MIWTADSSGDSDLPAAKNTAATPSFRCMFASIRTSRYIQVSQYVFHVKHFVRTTVGPIVVNLPHRFFDFRDPVRPLQHLARLGPIGSTDDAIAFHKVDQVGGAAIADAQAALQQGSGSLAKLDHKPHGIVEKRIVVVSGNFSGFPAAVGCCLAIFFGSLQEFLLILRLALRL